MRRASELEQFRREKDEFYGHDRRSPLTPDQQRGFIGLSYFPENGALVIEAKIDRSVQPGVVHMETTKGEEQSFRRFGVVRFEVDGQPAQVSLYVSERAPDALFLPFRDSTSGKQSYGAGRYLDLHAQGDDVVVDFNYAYNPNCAYSPDWNCPLPPAENWLKVPILAGEMKFLDPRQGPGHSQ